MSNESDKAWSEFSKAISEFVPPEPIVDRYRIYYNKEGEITHQVHNEPGDPTGPCLEMLWPEYKKVSHILHDSLVKNGELVQKPRRVKSKLLEPSDSGFAVRRNNLAFPDDNDPEYWDHGYN